MLSSTKISPSPRQRYWVIILLTLLAGLVRFHQLDHVPLRGDEAFTVRFWADDPQRTWENLAGWEPHPYGTFVLFWAWKSLAGPSELAMRTLPLLVNLLGVAGMYSVGWRVLKRRDLAYLAALLWALNPFQIWHSQDVRNYAIWSALSLLAFAQLVRVLERPSDRQWRLYGFLQVLALYSFLLEPFLMAAQLLYVGSQQRKHLKGLLATWTLILPLLIPWVIQIGRLATSGYSGTATQVTLRDLIEVFLPTLLFGEGRISLWAGLGLLLALRIGLWRGTGSTRVLLGLWLFLPLLLLTLAGTQMAIFRPRYILTITPPLLLALLWIAARPKRWPWLPYALTGIVCAVSLFSLYAYFYSDPPKAPDWQAMNTYLSNRANAEDFIILSNTDPAFDYYYGGPAASLPWSEISSLEGLWREHDGIFIQIGATTSPLSQTLEREAQFIPPAMPNFKYYRPYEALESEIEFPLALQVGEVALLRGYSLLGGDAFGLTVLLYWQPLQQTALPHAGFVHAVDSSSGLLLAQDDHAPLNGLAETTAWLPGDLLRDPYFLALPLGGDYGLLVGMYDSASLTRLPIRGEDGTLLGDSYQIE